MNAKFICLSAVFAVAWGCVLQLGGQGISIGSQKSPGVYVEGDKGQLVPFTGDSERFWPGMWKESTNGLRVQLIGWGTGLVHIAVSVGSTVTNSLGEFLAAPNGKFARFEMRASDGSIVPAKKGVTMEADFPQRLAIGDLPKWHDGSLKNVLGFFSNGPPVLLTTVKINDVFQISTQGVYTLEVGAVIYRFETNREYLTRVDLPNVVTNIYSSATTSK